MFFSYKTRQFLARIFPTLLTVLVILLVAAVCWLIWLQRFVVYTPEGVRFDFNLQEPSASAMIPQRPDKGQISIEYPEEPTVTLPPDTPIDPTIPDDPDIPDIPDLPDEPESTPLVGYYMDAKTVQNDPEGVRQQLEQLPAGTAVMIQLANYWGTRYYTSQYGKATSAANLQKMDSLLAWLAESDLYLIGRMPAFRDYYYALDNTSCGLAVPEGYLWTDSDRCYWLNPTKQTVLTRLCNIMRELKSLGFDEVVFDDFTMPTTDRIVFTGDRKEAIYNAADTLVTAGSAMNIVVSFITTDYDFRLPTGQCRLYIDNVEPSAVQDVLKQIQTPDNRTQVVFFCGTFDNRFDGCSVMRPIALAP